MINFSPYRIVVSTLYAPCLRLCIDIPPLIRDRIGSRGGDKHDTRLKLIQDDNETARQQK